MTHHASFWRGAAAVAVTGALLLPQTAAAADTVTLRLGQATPPNHSQTLRDVMMSEIVAKKTGGQVKIQNFPSGQLGKQNQQVEGVMSGTQDMFAGAAGFVGNYQDDWRILSVFYIFNSRDHIVEFTKSDLFEEMNKRLAAKTGARMINVTAVRAPSTFLSKKPILAVADIKGLKVRVPDIAGYVRSVKALDAAPTPIDWTDTYLAFSQGVVDVVQSSMDGIRSTKLTDHGKFILVTDHNWEPTGIIMNEKSYQKLTPEQRKILFDAAIEASEFYWKKAVEDDAAMRRTLMSQGAIVVEEDPAPWRDRILKGLVPDLEKEKFWTIPNLFEKIQALDPAKKKT